MVDQTPHPFTYKAATANEGPEYAIEISGLRKVYAPPSFKWGKRKHEESASQTSALAPKLALDGIDIKIPTGSLYGLLGPNGAGKSTLINILGGLTRKTEGCVKVWGRDIDTDGRNARASLGVVPQELVQEAFFTPREILENIAGYYGVPRKARRTMELLERVDLADKSDALFRSLSGGMKRRLMVAKAMVHSPPILILDEPSAGVDVGLRLQLWELVEELHRSGVTIILTTHYLEEAEALCEHITIMNHGRIVADQPKADIMSRLDHKTLVVHSKSKLKDVPSELVNLGFQLQDSGNLEMHYKPSECDFNLILKGLQKSGITISDISVREGDLEDVFLQLTSS